MTPNYECIVTGGGTDVEGELYIWQELGKSPIRHLLFRDEKAKSIYALSVSPSGKYLAAGYKNGLVRVWHFLKQDLSENDPFIFEIYHQLSPVTALAFLTDNLLISAGVNGKIRVISIDQEKYLEELDVHSGAICSVVALGSKVIAILGIDGNLKIWDMDSLSCEFQKEGLLFPKDPLSLFPSMAFSEEAGYLSAPSSDGKLHLFDLQDSCLHKTFQAHQGPFYATTACGKYLVTGGIGDHRLKVWDPREKMLLSELEARTSFLRLCSVGRKKVAAICLDPNKSQSLRLFLLPELRPSGAIKGLSLRSLVTVPVPIMEHLMNIELTRWKNALIDQAKSTIMSPKQMEPFLKQLANKGFWAEAKLLQAESAKLRNKPLHELGFLLQLTSAIKVSQSTASVFNRLAILFEQLNEPELSSQNYEKITYFLEGIEEIIHRLKVHPLIGLNPNKVVRTDISHIELAVQEMEKDSVLKRPFCWRLIIPSRKQRIFTTQVLHNLDLWEEHLKANTSSAGRSIEMEQETVILFDGQNTRELKWLRILQIGIECPSPYLDYAIEIIQKNRQAQGYGIFNPNKKGDHTNNVAIQNAALTKAYRSIFQQREVGNWLDQVHESMKGLDRQSSFISR